MPARFEAGTTLKLRRSFGDYPASDGWSMSLLLRGAGTLDVAATADGTDFLVILSATATAGLAAGTYRWTERVSKAGEVYTAASGTVDVTLDMGAAGAGEGQTHAERTLALIEAAIEGRIPQGMESYTVGGRQVQKIPLVELSKLRGIYAARVWRQKNPGQLTPGLKVVFRAS
jgi:hypothetical protein